MRNRLAGLGLLAIGWLGGCSPQDRDREAVREVEQAAPPSEQADTSKNVSTVRYPDTVWTATPVEKAGSQVATLIEVRTASHDNYDRIVFEFVGVAPGYRVGYASGSIQECGSGEEVMIAGSAWLNIQLSPANAHTEQGDITVRDRNRVWTDRGANLRALRLICDFEAVTEWVAGVRHPGKFRVLELTDPARIAVDVRKR
jgi:hypothetical protein